MSEKYFKSGWGLGFKKFQALSQHQIRGWTLRNLLFYFWLRYESTYRSHEILDVDEVIIGDNAVLNMLVLINLALNNDKMGRLKICLFDSPDTSKWAYHSLETKDFLHKATQICGVHFSDFSDVLEWVSALYKEIKGRCDVVSLNVDGLKINNINWDEYSKLNVVHLVNGQPSIVNGFLDNSVVIGAVELKIRDKIKDLILSKFRGVKTIRFKSEPKFSDESAISSFVIVANKIHLTSLVLECGTIGGTIESEDGYKFKYSPGVVPYGSAKEVKKSFLQHADMAVNDVCLELRKIVDKVRLG